MALQKILLAVDDSKDSEKAAMLVLDLAQNSKLDVVILHVCNDIPTAINDSNDSEDARKQFESLISEEAGKIVDFYKEIMGRMGIQATIRLTPGDIAEEIVKCAQAEKRDLIVMGATGRTGLAGAILGSISMKVIKESTLPILLAR